VIDDTDASERCLLVQLAQQMAGSNLTPPADPMLARLGYSLLGWICGIDEAVGDQQQCMGVILERSDGVFMVVIRGTLTIREWAEDADFGLTAHPIGGRVEEGFWRAYGRLSAIALGATDRRPLSVGISQAINSMTAPIEIVGHSLGAALAELLALEEAIARGGANVCATIIAPPHIGDSEFCGLFDRTVTHYKMYANEWDPVPHVPAGLSYDDPAKIVWMKRADVQADVDMDPISNLHHAVVYGACLRYNLTTHNGTVINWKGLTGDAAPLVACIRGPNVGVPA
jgi:hypothetical protein